MTIINPRTLYDLLVWADTPRVFSEESAKKSDDTESAFFEQKRLGSALCIVGEFDDAVLPLKRAIELNPYDAVVHCFLGLALYKQGKLDDAVLACKRTVELDPKHVIGHFNLGFTLEEQGKFDDAVLAYKRVVELDPKYASAHNHLGNILQKQGKLGDAIKHYQTAAELGDKDAIKALEEMGAGWSERAQGLLQLLDKNKGKDAPV